jgi:hypothetical protein
VTLEAVRRFVIPRRIVEETTSALVTAGAHGYELFVLWSGEFCGDELRIQTHHVPEQTSYQTEHGLLVRVEGDALHRLNVTLFESGESLAVQVHAHPTDAFHSETDSAFPIVTTKGGLSVVAPDFAHRGLFTDGTAVYRLMRRGWKHVSGRKLAQLVEVVA